VNTRVVCSGFGVITPHGEGVTAVRENVFKGHHGFSPITRFDTTNSYAKNGGEAPLSTCTYRNFTQLCVDNALKMSGLDRDRDAEYLRRSAVAVGNLGEGQAFFPWYNQFFNPNCEAIPPEFATTVFQDKKNCIDIHDRNPFAHANAVARMIGAQTNPVAFTNACVASANAIGYGYDQIRLGRNQCAFVGGVNVLHPLVFYNFDSSRAMATDVVRPFSRGRSGLLIGDGAAILILESLDSCLKRKAEPIAEILGWGLSSDGYHVSQPTPDGRGLAQAMDNAMRKAHCKPSDINYINAHGTGTPLNDASETLALKRSLGEVAAEIPVSSTKSTTGHMLEATGSVEAVFCLLALLDQKIPPTANYLGIDGELDLDYVTEGSREAPLDIVMSNSCAFGGNNCSIIFQRYRS